MSCDSFRFKDASLSLIRADLVFEHNLIERLMTSNERGEASTVLYTTMMASRLALSTINCTIAREYMRMYE